MNKQSPINKSIVLPSIPYLVILIIIIGANYFKIKTYATPELSFATRDTPSYIDSAKLDIDTLDFYTAKRPPAITAFYKLFAPASGYQILEIQSAFTNSQNLHIEFNLVTKLTN